MGECGHNHIHVHATLEKKDDVAPAEQEISHTVTAPDRFPDLESGLPVAGTNLRHTYGKHSHIAELFRFEHGAFSVENGKFKNVMGEPSPDAVDLHGAKVIPGLLDIHTHGNSGADFCDGDYDGLVRMAMYQAANGITSFAPSSLTVPVDTLEKAYATAARIVSDKPEKCAAVRGINMEGPFFCEAKKGAQNAAYLLLPDYDVFKRLNENCGGLIKIVDIAPELPGAVEFIKRAAKDCTVSVAHTDCSYDDAVAAFDAGATQLTHLYNAMPGIHHRKPGPIIAGCERDNVYAEIIGDGLHVHPASIRFAYRIFGAERMVLVSDSLRCCGLPDGEYDLGGLKAYLSGGVARLADGTLAGSATNVYECMLRVISFGVPECDAIRSATYNPAHQLGCLDVVGSIADGKCADFVVCNDDLTRKAVYLAGEKI